LSLRDNQLRPPHFDCRRPVRVFRVVRIKADAPVLRPDEPVPVNPVL